MLQICDIVTHCESKGMGTQMSSSKNMFSHGLTLSFGVIFCPSLVFEGTEVLENAISEP